MRSTRGAVAALAGTAALLVAGGTAALADSGGSNAGADNQARCQTRLAKIADQRGLTVAQLEAQIRDRLTARVDAALQAGKITADRAAALKERIASFEFCSGAHHPLAGHGARVMLRAAAHFLGLSGPELRAELPGTSLAALAQKQGKSVDDLKKAMLAPATDRLAKAVSSGHLSQTRADAIIARLGSLAEALASKTFPAA
jgi:hypothetical protein